MQQRKKHLNPTFNHRRKLLITLEVKNLVPITQKIKGGYCPKADKFIIPSNIWALLNYRIRGGERSRVESGPPRRERQREHREMHTT